MCQKLSSDDQVSSTNNNSSYFMKSFPKWAFPICAIAGACYFGYRSKKDTLSFWGAQLRHEPSTANVEDINKARSARLKKFTELSSSISS